MSGASEEFLEHYGKKGMKWGVRNKTSSARTPQEKAARKKKIVKASIGLVAIGVAAALFGLRNYGKVKVIDIPKRAPLDLDAFDRAVIAKIKDGSFSDGVDRNGTGVDRFGRKTRPPEEVIAEIEARLRKKPNK